MTTSPAGTAVRDALADLGHLPKQTPAERLEEAARDLAFHRNAVFATERRLLAAEREMRAIGQFDQIGPIVRAATGGLVRT